jgi:hypothetical protein
MPHLPVKAVELTRRLARGRDGRRAFGFIGIVLGPVVGAVLTAMVKTYALVPETESEGAPLESP